VDDALRRRLDALVALLGLVVVLLAALVGARNVAALVGALLVWLAALAAVWVVRPSWGSG
jgi:membrane associated rhomboid family serine protease